MPFIPIAPPQLVSTSDKHWFDYVTVDPKRRRVYAAHGGNASLLIVNADTGKVLGQVHVGPMAGVAVNEATGHVYTGDGREKAVSEVDPVRMKEIRRVSVDGPVDAIAYDPVYHRIYADEDDGTRVFVIDAKTFKQIGTVNVPGNKPEYLAVDPRTHQIYQNIATNNEIAVIDPKSLKVTRIIKTPDVTNNHALQFNPFNRTLLVAGENEVLAVYSAAGKELAKTWISRRVDQCSFYPSKTHPYLACAANSNIVVYGIPAHGAPKLEDRRLIAARMHNVAVDPATGNIWTVWGSQQGDYVQGFRYRP